nr:uncharacterized protein LOC109149839 isoform X2 [Ipomoea batatas]
MVLAEQILKGVRSSEISEWVEIINLGPSMWTTDLLQAPNDEIGIRNDIAKSDLVLECVAKYSVVAAESLAILRQLIGQVQELLELYGGTLPPLFLLITFFSFNLHRHTTPGF